MLTTWVQLFDQSTCMIKLLHVMKNIDLVYNAVSSLRKLSDCTKWSIVFKTQVYMYLYQACSYYVWVNSKGNHAPPPGWPPGIWHFLIFLVKFPTMWAISLVKCPPPWGFFRGQMPCPPGWSDTETQIDFRTRFSTLPFLLFFVYQFNVFVHHFFLCT